MKLLTVTFIPKLNKSCTAAAIAKALESAEEHKIEIAPWPMYDYKPEVSFKMVYSNDCIFLKYLVIENEMRVLYLHSNDPVYKDSCVEFFISFGGTGYYNFEFNCIGACLAAFGENRERRTFLPATTIEKINSSSSILATNINAQRVVTWELILMIPFDVFCYHNFTALQGLSCFGNFYKCGDDMEQPHYLAWNPVFSPLPDFHLKEFFGAIQFV